jgi:hypothetical protein
MYIEMHAPGATIRSLAPAPTFRSRSDSEVEDKLWNFGGKFAHVPDALDSEIPRGRAYSNGLIMPMAVAMTNNRNRMDGRSRLTVLGLKNTFDLVEGVRRRLSRYGERLVGLVYMGFE